MGAENEDRCLAVEKDAADHQNREFSKESRISYTREVLLSFSELDECRELPSGVDNSILRELEDRSRNLPQPCHDSVTGPFGSKCSPMWLNPEKGLLGSGDFPRISRCAQGTSAHILQNCSSHLLSRSSEPYRPPHLLKAKSPGKEISNDQYNDETFGSSEHASQEKVNEERRRRESFELMRKEQERAIQDTEKKIAGEQKENINPDTIFVEDDGGDMKLVNNLGESKVIDPSLATNCDSENCKTTWIMRSTQLSPGFTGKSLENNLGTSSANHPPLPLQLSDFGEDHASKLLSHSSESAYSFLEEGIILEDIFLSKWFGYYSAKNLSPRDWISSCTEDSHSSTFEAHATSHCFNSCPQRRMDLSDVAGYLRSSNNSDEFYVPETGNISTSPSFVSEVHSRSFEKNPSLHILQTASPKESESTESSRIKKPETNVVARNGVTAPPGFPLIAKDRHITLPTFGDSSSEKNTEAIMTSGFIKQAHLSKGEDGELDSSKELATKHRSISSSTEIDDICLPDEDSLITIEDIIFPMNPFSLDGDTLDGDTSDSLVGFTEKQADSGISLNANTAFQNSESRAGFSEKQANFSIQKSSPHAWHPRPNHHVNPQQSTKSKIQDLRSYRCRPRYRPPFLPTPDFVPFQYPYSTAAPFNHPFNRQLLPEMHIYEIPPHQYGMPRGTSIPSNFPCYDYIGNSFLHSNPNYQHHR